MPVAKAHELDENAGSRLRGVLKPIRTVQQTATPGTNGKGTKRSFTTLQKDSVRGAATPLTTDTTIDARNERNTSTGYNLRIPTTAVPPVGAAMKSARRFRASTHLAASIASEDPFTARAVEEIKEEINTDDSIRPTNDDLQKVDYIPPNRRMMLKCKQKDK